MLNVGWSEVPLFFSLFVRRYHTSHWLNLRSTHALERKYARKYALDKSQSQLASIADYTNAT